MRKPVLALLFLTIFNSAFSQRLYFIYLQAESRQAFFVKMDEKLYSSTASGYLILTRLKDSTYNFSVGFNGSQAGEQKFSCVINKKDHGYLVKNFGEKGWGLFDLQTSAVQMASGDKKDLSVTNVPVNAFTELLAKAADDSSLKQKIVLPEEKKAEAVVKAPEKKAETASDAVVNKTSDSAKSITDSLKKEEVAAKKLPASAVAQNNPVVTTAVKPADNTIHVQETTQKKEEPPVNKDVEKKSPELAKPAESKIIQDTSNRIGTASSETFTRSKVIRKSESSTTEGFGITYIDVQPGGIQDTIKVLIPDEKKVQVTNIPGKDTLQTKPEATVAPATTIPGNDTKVSNRNSCKTIASDADFYKLRKKMASEKSDASMLDEANKVFKLKCFTSTQIKNLSALFLGDGGKYNFLDASYAHVSDPDNFASLQSELKDEYFINRFKAMLR